MRTGKIRFNKENIHIISINLINKGIIPISYIASTKIRLLIYRKIKSTLGNNDLIALIEELKDRIDNDEEPA